MLLCGLRLPLWITFVGRFSRYVTVTRPSQDRYKTVTWSGMTVTPTQELGILLSGIWLGVKDV